MGDVTPLIVTNTICLILSTFVFLPLEIFYMRKYWLLRDSSIITKRRPSLLMSGFICNQFSFVLLFGFILILSIIKVFLYQTVTTTIIIILMYSFLIASYSIYITRLWLICSDLNMNIKNISHWYRSNDSKNGSWRKIKWYLSLYAVIWLAFILVQIFTYSSESFLTLTFKLNNVIGNFLIWIPLIFLLLYHYQTPDTHDSIGMFVLMHKCTPLHARIKSI